MGSISKVLEDEFAIVITQLFEAAALLGFDLRSEDDVERLNRITDGGRIRRSYKNDRKGNAKACSEISEYAAANSTERALGDAFHFLHKYQQICECHASDDKPAGCDVEAELIKLLSTLSWITGWVQAYSGDRVDVECKFQVFLSENGRTGAVKRHAPMGTLKAWAIEQYRIGKWPSANAAAHALKDEVMIYGKTIGAHLSEANAQRTIAEWIRKSV